MTIIRILYDIVAATSQIVWCHSSLKEVSVSGSTYSKGPKGFRSPGLWPLKSRVPVLQAP